MKIEIIQSPLTGDEPRELQSDMDRIVADVTDACGKLCFATGNLNTEGSRYYAITQTHIIPTNDEITEKWISWRDDQYGQRESVTDQEKDDDFGPVPKPELWQRLT